MRFEYLHLLCSLRVSLKSHVKSDFGGVAGPESVETQQQAEEEAEAARR
jgi:hypothetical protein